MAKITTEKVAKLTIRTSNISGQNTRKKSMLHQEHYRE